MIAQPHVTTAIKIPTPPFRALRPKNNTTRKSQSETRLEVAACTELFYSDDGSCSVAAYSSLGHQGFCQVVWDQKAQQKTAQNPRTKTGALQTQGTKHVRHVATEARVAKDLDSCPGCFRAVDSKLCRVRGLWNMGPKE